MSLLLTIAKVPTNDQAKLTDHVWVNPMISNLKTVNIENTVYKVGFDPRVLIGEIGVNGPSRMDHNLHLGEKLYIPYPVQVLHTYDYIAVPVGQSGTTVRNGTKWASYPQLIVDLCECGPHNTHIVIGQAELKDRAICTFHDTPAWVVEMEQCVKSRTYTGLLHAMKKAYPGFMDTDEVTWLKYTRTN